MQCNLQQILKYTQAAQSKYEILIFHPNLLAYLRKLNCSNMHVALVVACRRSLIYIRSYYSAKLSCLATVEQVLIDLDLRCKDCEYSNYTHCISKI